MGEISIDLGVRFYVRVFFSILFVDFSFNVKKMQKNGKRTDNWT